MIHYRDTATTTKVIATARTKLWSRMAIKLRRPTLLASRGKILLWQSPDGLVCSVQVEPLTGPQSSKSFARISVNRLVLPPMAHRLLRDAGWCQWPPAWSLELTTTLNELPTMAPPMARIIAVRERAGCPPDHPGLHADNLVWWGGAAPSALRNYCWSRRAYNAEWPDADRGQHGHP